MSGPTYISHPSLWEQFRHTQRGENFVPSIQRKRQRGGGILNRRRAYMIPVKHLAPPQTALRQVTPVAAERERAQSDLKETMRNDEPHMSLRKPIKKKFQQKRLSSSSTSKGKGRVQEKRKKTTNKKNSRKTQKGKGRPTHPDGVPIFSS